MIHRSILAAAAIATVSASLAQAQVLINENYDDGLAASRWTFTARENGVDPSAATPDGSVNFNFDYTNVKVESNNGPLGQFTLPIGAAPGGGGMIGVQIHVNDNAAGASTTTAISQAAIMPATVNVGSNYILKTDMYLNYNAPAQGSGSTESYIIGLNADGANVVGDDLNGTLAGGGAAPAANKSANGYAFSGSSDGDNNGDYRVLSRRLSNTDGSRYGDAGGLINTAYTGTSRQPGFDGTGDYTGVQLLPDETNGGPGNGGTIPYRGFNNSNSYYRDEVMPNSQGFEVAGVPGKHWVQVQVEQHGKIALYMINGHIINHLFLPSELSGKPSLGLIDQTAGMPNDVTDSYVLFDNTSVTSLTATGANTIPAGATYVTFNGGGTQTANGAATVNGITMDTTPTTLAGTGTLTLGSPAGAIWSGNGAQVISKPLSIVADSAIYVDKAEDSLTISNLTTDPSVDLHKVGLGKLTMPAGFNVKSLTLTHNSKVALSGAGGTKTTILALELQPALTATFPLSANLATLDFGRSVVAIDYSNAASIGTPALPLSPLTQMQQFLNNGFAADGSGNPQWTGTGLVTSAPEVQGAAFAAPGNLFTVRITEASALGYSAANSAWMGKTIDDTTVLFGFTLKTDSNLDQRVEFADLVTVAQNYNSSGLDPLTSWTKGDATADGAVNFDDLALLAQTYGMTVSSTGSVTLNAAMAASFGEDWKLAQSLVPEPASLSLLGMGALALVRRRR